MKIVLVNRYFFPDQSATSRVISSIAFSLAQRGFQVVAVASREIHNQPGSYLSADETINGVQVKRLASARHGRRGLVRRSADYVLFHVLAFLWLLRNVSAADIAVVCTDPPLLSVTSSIAIRLRKAVMVNWIMDLFPETAIELGFFKRWPWMGQWVARLRDRSLGSPGIAVCPTGRMAEYLRHQGVPRNRLAVMHHCSDAEEIYPVSADINSLRARWGLRDTFVIGYSGNFGRAHEFSTIIGAAERLKHRSDIRFLLIGGGHQHAAVMESARSRDLDNVIFKPLQPVSDLAESLCVADVHLISLRPELEHCIIPSKFYGILAAGRPSIFIGDPDGEVPRALAAHACGQSIMIGADGALATLIEELRDNPHTCTRMGEAARRLMVAEYSRDQAADAWCALIWRLQNAHQLKTSIAQEISP
jgi:glycosyltransferase involved in cell wall biosynthesis